MKALCIFVITSIFLFPGILFAQTHTEKHVPIDVEAIKLRPPFVRDDKVAQEFQTLAAEFSERIRQDLYNEVFMAKMVDFIAKYPTDKAALSAKYYLAVYLLESKEKLTFQEGSLWSLIMQDMFAIFEAITLEAPNSWQGKLSSFVTPELYILMGSDRKTALVEIRRELPVYLEVQNEPGYQKFQEHMGRKIPIELTLRDLIISLESEQGNIEKATEELAIIKEKSQNQDVILYLEKNISDAYRSQLDRGLSGASAGHLLNLLTSTEEPQKLRHIAMALGNRAIWGTLDLTEQQQEIINEVVSGYIDRATSKDFTEREEARHQIERLWRLAVPALLEHLEDEDLTTAEFVADLLVLMRNEELINVIIEKAKNALYHQQRERFMVVLSRMNEPRQTLVAGRKSLDPEQSEELYQRLIIPALEELKAEK